MSWAIDWKKLLVAVGIGLFFAVVLGAGYLTISNLQAKIDVLEKKADSALENSLRAGTATQKPVTGANFLPAQPSVSTNNNSATPVLLDDLSWQTSLATLAAEIAKTKQQIVTPQVGYPGEFYIPMGSGVTTQEGRWIDVGSAQAIIDTASYPIIKAVYFESVLRLPNAQGEIRARLAETTLPYVYSGNEVRSQSGTGELVSSRINLQPGKRTYKVQLYSSIGQGVLDFARIRVVVR